MWPLQRSVQTVQCSHSAFAPNCTCHTTNNVYCTRFHSWTTKKYSHCGQPIMHVWRKCMMWLRTHTHTHLNTQLNIQLVIVETWWRKHFARTTDYWTVSVRNVYIRAYDMFVGTNIKQQTCTAHETGFARSVLPIAHEIRWCMFTCEYAHDVSAGLLLCSIHCIQQCVHTVLYE